MLSLLALAHTASLAASTTSPTTAVETANPLTEAERACLAGSALCQVVTSATGSARAGTWTELLVGLPLKVVLILLMAALLRWLLHKIIQRTVEQIATGRPINPSWFGDRASAVLQSSPTTYQRRAQRARTIGTMLRSIATGVISVVAILMILAEVGLNIAPLLASAGIVGVAIGFGAQSLVKDFLSGMFMLVEDQYGVGDLVNLGEAIGTVESVGLRVTQVRDVQGTLWYVPNGSITQVGNMSQGWSRAVVDVTVAYGTNLEKATTIMLEQGTALRDDPAWDTKVVDAPEVWGVESMSSTGVVLRIVQKTVPTQNVAVGRELRQRINDAFAADGVAFPFGPAATGPAVAASSTAVDPTPNAATPNAATP